MTLVVRGVAVLTVLLSLALMAVSAYAAKTEEEHRGQGASQTLGQDVPSETGTSKTGGE